MRIVILLFTSISTIGIANAQKSTILGWPESVKVSTDQADFLLTSNDHLKWANDGIEVTFTELKGLMNVDLSSPAKSVKTVKISCLF